MAFRFTASFTFSLSSNNFSGSPAFVIFFSRHVVLLCFQKFIIGVFHTNSVKHLLDDFATEMRKFASVPSMVQQVESHLGGTLHFVCGLREIGNAEKNILIFL